MLLKFLLEQIRVYLRRYWNIFTFVIETFEGFMIETSMETSVKSELNIAFEDKE